MRFKLKLFRVGLKCKVEVELSDAKVEVGLRVETRLLSSVKMKPPTTKENTTKQPETTSPGIISAKVKIMEVRKGKRRKKRSIMVKLTLMGGWGVSLTIKRPVFLPLP